METIAKILTSLVDGPKSAFNALKNAIKRSRRNVRSYFKHPYYRVLEKQYRPLPSNSTEFTDLQLYTPSAATRQSAVQKTQHLDLQQEEQDNALQLLIEGSPDKGQRTFSSLPVRLVTKNKLGRKRRFRPNLRDLGQNEAQKQPERLEGEKQPLSPIRRVNLPKN